MFAPSTPRQKKQASRLVAAPARPQQVPAQPHFLKRRSTILAISSALIIAVGAYTGAVLKTDVQKKIVREEQKKEDPAHQIERLNTYMQGLHRERERIESKIREAHGEEQIGRERRR